jgi:hypothetical protein
MGILAPDTERSAEKVQLEILRALPAWKKLKLLDEACQATRAMMLAGLRSRHPKSHEEEIQRMLMDLLVGEETANRVWGPRARSKR